MRVKVKETWREGSDDGGKEDQCLLFLIQQVIKQDTQPPARQSPDITVFNGQKIYQLTSPPPPPTHTLVIVSMGGGKDDLENVNQVPMQLFIKHKLQNVKSTL